MFSQLPKNVLLEAYFDTCHSGTWLKAADLLIDRIPRYLPPPTYKGLNEVVNSTLKGLRSSADEKDLRHHILWAACKDNETSSDCPDRWIMALGIHILLH